MGPALQRLLLRPFSLQLLRYLVGTSIVEKAQYVRKPLRDLGRARLSSFHAQAAATAGGAHGGISDPVDDHGLESDVRCLFTVPDSLRHSSITKIEGQVPQVQELAEIYKSVPPRSWERSQFTADDLEFESSIRKQSPDMPRLLDSPEHGGDMKLWGFMLSFRTEKYGVDGAMAIWKEMRARRLDIPVVGALANHFWTSFLQLGFRDPNVLSEIIGYANTHYDTSSSRWPTLYVYVMQHCLLEGLKISEVISWHNLLIRRHEPCPAAYARFIRNVALSGDLVALKQIYLLNHQRNVYSKIVPALVQRQDFAAAQKWHFFLLRYGDTPRTAKSVEPLLQHLLIHNPPVAGQVSKSLVSSGVAFAAEVSKELENTATISRQMMNIIHGQSFNIKVKEYNDSLGARWFATRWISVDIAINAIHALGVGTIGPLSLQSIALREPSGAAVSRRIEQLQELGISIGDSIYSRAIQIFARENKDDLLKSLLESDQHPDTFQDWKLQETLMYSYAETGDWMQYRRALAVRLIDSKSPDIEKYNITLRSYATLRDRPRLIQILEDMRVKGVPVKAFTIRWILRNVLRPRHRGKNPVSLPRHDGNDLDVAISILMTILKYNGFVPVTFWTEIIRRLGMAGRLDDLDHLCLWLAGWYQTSSTFRSRVVGLSSPALPESGLHLAPTHIPASHALHPLRVLFSDSLQQSIVEWGFIHTLLGSHSRKSAIKPSISLAVSPNEQARQCNRGVKLLQQLNNRGIYVSAPEIRRAIYIRLVALYGSRVSDRIRNRRAKAVISVTLEHMVRQIDLAWGSKVFPDFKELEQMIKSAGIKGEPRLNFPVKLEFPAAPCIEPQLDTARG